MLVQAGADSLRVCVILPREAPAGLVRQFSGKHRVSLRAQALDVKLRKVTGDGLRINID
jgi:hypothetical protein